MKNKELIIIIILTLVIAFMDISGLPSVLLFNITLYDIAAYIFPLMINFILIGILSFGVLKFLCPSWHLGLGKKNLKMGFKKYFLAGFIPEEWVPLLLFLKLYLQ